MHQKQKQKLLELGEVYCVGHYGEIYIRGWTQFESCLMSWFISCIHMNGLLNGILKISQCAVAVKVL